MISCCECSESFEDASAYAIHVKSTHYLLFTYRCSVLTCERIFSSLDSFVRHVRDKHKSSKTDIPDMPVSLNTVIQESKAQLESSDLQAQCSSVNVNYFQNSSDSESDDESDIQWINEYIKLIDTTKDTAAKSVNDTALHFSGKLYNFNDIARARVNDIISDASEMFDSSLKLVKDELFDKFKKLGASNSYLSEIDEIFENFAKPFQSFETEKQRFAQFYKNGTLILPESYKI